MSETIEIANHIAGYFDNGGVAVPPDPRQAPLFLRRYLKGPVIVHGHLNLSFSGITTRSSARCHFVLGLNWRTQPPALYTSEKWSCFRRSQPKWGDWHIFENGSLCYVLDDEWRDVIQEKAVEGTGAVWWQAVAYFAANNARYLLYHHLEAYRQGLNEWPKEWPQWPHADKGRRAYAKIKAARGEDYAESVI